MILLDWTRMGHTYCLAGVVLEDGRQRVVRPLPARWRESPVRNVGWSPYLLEGHARWEAFELDHPEPATPQPPHLEDVWVRTLRPRRRSATLDERRAILGATVQPPDVPLFGAELIFTRAAAHLPPATGERSLATALISTKEIVFTVARREGVVQADYRVTLPIPGHGPVVLPLKDHFLLARAEQAGDDLDEQARRLTQCVRQMGERVAVRLGLSRRFQATPTRGPGACWLMADGFFSLIDPQP